MKHLTKAHAMMIHRTLVNDGEYLAARCLLYYLRNKMQTMTLDVGDTGWTIEHVIREAGITLRPCGPDYSFLRFRIIY